MLEGKIPSIEEYKSLVRFNESLDQNFIRLGASYYSPKGTYFIAVQKNPYWNEQDEINKIRHGSGEYSMTIVEYDNKKIEKKKFKYAPYKATRITEAFNQVLQERRDKYELTQNTELQSYADYCRE